MKTTVPLSIRKNCANFPVTADLTRAASCIAEAAWTGRGVRVFRWPCGHLIVTRIGSVNEGGLLQTFGQYLLGTWAKGALYRDVLAELEWVKEAL